MAGMKVLVACERFGRVRDAFIAKGCEAMSCDLLPTEVPGSHYQGDVRDVLDYPWDLMIAHPDCTHLAVSGAKHFESKRLDGRQQSAMAFFMFLTKTDIPRYAIENPVSIISTLYRKPDQIVHPYHFGDEARKSTCLWLKNLPPLQPTDVVGQGKDVIHGGKRIQKWYSNRTRDRSMTFQGMASAMAAQWGGLKAL